MKLGLSQTWPWVIVPWLSFSSCHTEIIMKWSKWSNEISRCIVHTRTSDSTVCNSISARQTLASELTASTILDILKWCILHISSHSDITAITNENLVTFRPSFSYLIFIETRGRFPLCSAQEDSDYLDYWEHEDWWTSCYLQ